MWPAAIPRNGKRSAVAIIADLTNNLSRYELAEFNKPDGWDQFAHEREPRRST